ncbi:MAG: phosphoketolase family protein [Patescibacteria group bacterium]
MKKILPDKQEIINVKKNLEATNYIASSALYLKSNFWLQNELTFDDIKPRILGHWGTVPGLNLIYACVNALIKATDQKTVFVTGPGHGAPAIIANLFLEEAISKYYPEITYDKEGLERLIKGFSWPKQFPSHTYPGLPGSIHEGGELGYSLGTAFGAMFDNPDYLAACVIGDGEAETGALAASWHSNKFFNPRKDGFVLPILHLNGYKISNPTIFSTMSDEEIDRFFEGLGYKAIFVSQYTADDIVEETLNGVFEAYNILQNLRENWQPGDKVILPVLVLRTMKGWTGPKYNKDQKVEDNNYSHGIPLKKPKTDEYELDLLSKWLKGYDITNLFHNDDFSDEFINVYPEKKLRMGFCDIAQTQAPEPLVYPDIKLLDEEFKVQGSQEDSELEVFSEYVVKLLSHPNNRDKFRIFSPDESESNFLEKIFKQTKKVYNWPLRSWDTNFADHGQFMEILSEQTLMSWMQGYILTGRNGLLVSYEAFLSIIASQIDQYIKFIRQAQDFKWRAPLPSLNFIATSSVWRQDHNGFTHQNPILINTMLAKHVDFVNVYFPSDVNTMLIAMEKCFKSQSTVNLIIAGKTKMPQWLSLDESKKQMESGIMEWSFATNSQKPDVVVSSAGDYMTLEALAGISIISEICPDLKYRFINVSALSCQGFGCGSNLCLTDQQLCEFYTEDKDVIFNFHGYPEAMKQMLYDTCLAGRTKIHGYIEKGTTTTPFDMQVKNNTSRYHIAIEMLHSASKFNPKVKSVAKSLITSLEKKIEEHKKYIVEIGDDMPEIKSWKWKGLKQSQVDDNNNQ